jgi:hypothetical protein
MEQASRLGVVGRRRRRLWLGLGLGLDGLGLIAFGRGDVSPGYVIHRTLRGTSGDDDGARVVL